MDKLNYQSVVKYLPIRVDIDFLKGLTDELDNQ